MDKQTAAELVRAVRLFEEPVNLATELTNRIENEEERKKYRRYIAEIAALVTIDLLGDIVSEHPELDPYKDYFKK